jgi:hypothetical protein
LLDHKIVVSTGPPQGTAWSQSADDRAGFGVMKPWLENKSKDIAIDQGHEFELHQWYPLLNAALKDMTKRSRSAMRNVGVVLGHTPELLRERAKYQNSVLRKANDLAKYENMPYAFFAMDGSHKKFSVEAAVEAAAAAGEDAENVAPNAGHSSERNAVSSTQAASFRDLVNSVSFNVVAAPAKLLSRSEGSVSVPVGQIHNAPELRAQLLAKQEAARVDAEQKQKKATDANARKLHVLKACETQLINHVKRVINKLWSEQQDNDEGKNDDNEDEDEKQQQQKLDALDALEVAAEAALRDCTAKLRNMQKLTYAQMNPVLCAAFDEDVRPLFTAIDADSELYSSQLLPKALNRSQRDAKNSWRAEQQEEEEEEEEEEEGNNNEEEEGSVEEAD